jgi:bifunctional DNA primase/polymerase-like protein
MEKLDTALAYAERGFFVAPVSAAGRALRPATRNAMPIRQWWERWPDADIGCDLGKSELMMVEIKDTDGDRLAKLLPPTTMMAVADDMRRYFYRAPKYGIPWNREVRSPCGTATLKIYGGDNTIVVMPALEKR